MVVEEALKAGGLGRVEEELEVAGGHGVADVGGGARADGRLGGAAHRAVEARLGAAKESGQGSDGELEPGEQVGVGAEEMEGGGQAAGGVEGYGGGVESVEALEKAVFRGDEGGV